MLREAPFGDVKIRNAALSTCGSAEAADAAGGGNAPFPASNKGISTSNKKLLGGGHRYERNKDATSNRAPYTWTVHSEVIIGLAAGPVTKTD